MLLVGDSTMAPQTGYGNALCQRLEPATACLNMARGGRSTSLATEYPATLARYVAEVRAAGGQPVLLTPLTRRSFKGGELQQDLAPWAEAARAVARAEGVPLIDLHASSAEAVQALGSEQADLLAQGPAGSPEFDRTHLGPRGACLFAEQVLAGLRQVLPAVQPTGPSPDCMALPPPTLPPPLQQANRATYEHPGWAVGTLGGRGGRVVKVTTLKPTGPGSLRAALEAAGPRVVVFEVGGVIDLQGASLTLRKPFITVAGQTAPSPGITLIKGELNIATHDVIVQHLMFRPGAYSRPKRSGQDHDGISTQGGAHHVIVDHCSFSWATDENLSVGGPRFNGADAAAWRQAASHDITFSHNLIYEGLGDSVHVKGEHSKGTLVHDNASNVFLFGNIYASNRERNALFKGGAQGAMVNNLIYNPGGKAAHYNLVAHEWAGQAYETGKLALVANVLRHGPDTRPGTPLFALGGHGDVELHLEGNLAMDREGQPVPQTGRYTSGTARVLKAERPHLPPRLQWLPAERLEAELTLAAGARPWDRDPIDFKLLSDLAEDRGRIPDSETDSSGYPGGPRYAPRTRPFDPTQWNLLDMSPRAGWASLFVTRAK